MATLKSNESARVKKLIAGANQHLSTTTSVMIGNVSYSLSTLTQLFQSYADAFDGAQAAKATYEDKLTVRRAQTAAVQAILTAFVAYVRVTFGASSQVLNDFGISPPKVKAPMSTEQQVEAVEKRASTRAARHTMGKRQKLAIKAQEAAPAHGGALSPEPLKAGVAPVPTK